MSRDFHFLVPGIVNLFCYEIYMYNSEYESCFSHLSLHPEDSVLYVGLVYYAIFLLQFSIRR